MPSRSSFVNNSNSIQTQFNHTYVSQPQATRIGYQVIFNFKMPAQHRHTWLCAVQTAVRESGHTNKL